MELGEGYCFRDEPCVVRRLAGNHDVLRLIAARVRDLPPRTLAPPPIELRVLRGLNARLDRERVAYKDAAEMATVDAGAAAEASQRALRREATAKAETATAKAETTTAKAEPRRSRHRNPIRHMHAPRSGFLPPKLHAHT